MVVLAQHPAAVNALSPRFDAYKAVFSGDWENSTFAES
jgi:hypothetical protein